MEIIGAQALEWVLGRGGLCRGEGSLGGGHTIAGGAGGSRLMDIVGDAWPEYR